MANIHICKDRSFPDIAAAPVNNQPPMPLSSETPTPNPKWDHQAIRPCHSQPTPLRPASKNRSSMSIAIHAPWPGFRSPIRDQRNFSTQGSSLEGGRHLGLSFFFFFGGLKLMVFGNVIFMLISALGASGTDKRL